VQSGLEESVQPTQTGTGRFPLENFDLLPEGKNFKCVVATVAEEHVDCRHELTVSARRNVVAANTSGTLATY
jgi:hypothetical protein